MFNVMVECLAIFSEVKLIKKLLAEYEIYKLLRFLISSIPTMIRIELIRMFSNVLSTQPPQPQNPLLL